MSTIFDVPTTSVIIASASVVAGAIYYMLETRHERRVRQTESILRLSPWFNMNAKEMQEDIALACSVHYKDTEEYFEKYTGKPEYAAMKLLGNYFEGIGLLVFRKLVEVDIVYDFWGDIALSTWNDYHEIIYAMRRNSGEPRMFKFWENLSKEMRKRKKSVLNENEANIKI
jgi:hypothetical protein